MPTYFVNPLGSNTAPYDTRAKGATTFKGLLDNIVQADGDICEVCDGGEIDDTAVVIPNWTKKWIIRSHSENLSKPIVKTAPGDTGFGFVLGADEMEVYNIVTKKYGTPTSQWIAYNPSSLQKLIVKGCEFWGENLPTSPNAVGIWISDPGYMAQYFLAEDNDFYNCYRHIQTPGAPE